MLSQPAFLSEDVLRLVLAFSTPASIRSCQQVCRMLRDLVKSDTRLQYLLELDACGYVEPANPRQDLNYLQKLEMLQNHRSYWDHPENVIPIVFKLDFDERAVTYEYAGGVYVQGVRHHDTSVWLIRQLHFCQLPSPNRGLEYKEWIIPDLRFDAEGFGIDPEQDLLVLLERSEGVYKVHLRTMSTNEVHPKISPDQSIITNPHLTVVARPFYFGISGCVLAILFRSRDKNNQSYVVIWDWATGQELSRVPTAGTYSASFTLLSKDSFVIPRFSQSYEADRPVPGDTYGSLDVYQFGPHTTATAKTVRVASFALPLLDQAVKTSVRVWCTPTSAIPTTSPRVFDLSPGNRLLCVSVYVTPFSGDGPSRSIGTLYVPCSCLLDSITTRGLLEIPQPESIVVPWVDWAEKTSWVDTSNLRHRNRSFVFGQRMAGVIGDIGEQNIRIFDFDQRRLKSRHRSDTPAGREIHSPRDRIVGSDSNEQVGEPFYQGFTRASSKYVESTLPLAVVWPNSVMIDDEHVIIKNVSNDVWSDDRQQLTICYEESYRAKPVACSLHILG